MRVNKVINPGGIDELVDAGILVGVAYDRGDKGSLPPGKLREVTFKGYQRAVGNRAVMLTRGMQITLVNIVSVTCVSHGGVVLTETNPVPGRDENDMSISLLITYCNFRYFVRADIEGYTEKKIAERDLVLDLDVYQANHHGSFHKFDNRIHAGHYSNSGRDLKRKSQWSRPSQLGYAGCV